MKMKFILVVTLGLLIAGLVKSGPVVESLLTTQEAQRSYDIIHAGLDDPSMNNTKGYNGPKPNISAFASWETW